MVNPFFSIVIVCYQAGEELKKTAESVLKQTDGDFEIIVKDGGSTDGSLDALPDDPRIRVLSGKDKGIYDAMNRACEKIRGRYVLFLNCGDYLYDGDVLISVRREAQRCADKSGAQTCIFYGNTYERKTGSLVMSNPKLNAFACYRNVPCHQCCFYDARLLGARECKPSARKDAVRMRESIRMGEKGALPRTGEVYRTKYRVRADYEHFLWCFFAKRAQTVYMPLTVCSYEGGGFSETKENLRRAKREHREITALYMTGWQRFRYRAALLLTLSPLRTKLAQSRRFSGMYQAVKSFLYRKRT